MMNINSESETFDPKIELYLWILSHCLIKLKTVRKPDVIKQKFVLYQYDKNMNKVENMDTVIRFFARVKGKCTWEAIKHRDWFCQGISIKIILFCAVYSAFFYAWILFSLGAGISFFATLMIPFKQRK